MLRTYHRWRYSRRERRPAYTFHSREYQQFGPAFGHYLSTHAAHQDANDPMERRRRWKWVRRAVFLLLFLGFAGWLIREALFAVRLF